MPPVKTWSTPQKNEKKSEIPCALCGESSLFKPSIIYEGLSYARCGRCGLVQINPQPLHAEIMNRYDQGDDYLCYELTNEKPFLDLQVLALGDAGFWPLETELKAAMGQRGQIPKVLDIGCATGALLGELKSRGWDCTGIEISHSQAQYSREKRGIPVHERPLEDCCFPDAAFDAVLASHLIEHLNNPASFVSEVRRILKAKGRFLVTTPNIGGFQAKLFRGKWRSAIFDHLYLFSVKTLSSLLKKSGFGIEKISTWGGLAAGIAPLPVKRFFDKAAKRFGFGDVMIIRAVKV
ncbi:MAG: class I SAM-dependent methyltransferase [Treponema sp.]|jgi:SAM-dependent methyltransferase|nr:class I SAM-dependent methyltransferase [Treponema sp.]